MASRGLSPRPRVLSLSLSRVTASPFTLIFARLRALGKISRIGWKRWLSSSYRGFVPLISSLNRIASYTIYRIFINLIALGESGHLFQGNFFFWRRDAGIILEDFFVSSFILDF